MHRVGSKILQNWSALSFFSRLVQDNTHFDQFVFNVHVENFSRLSAASLLYFGTNPCNCEFEHLHRYPAFCASVSRKYVAENLLCRLKIAPCMFHEDFGFVASTSTVSKLRNPLSPAARARYLLWNLVKILRMISIIGRL